TGDNVKHVWGELTGDVSPADLQEEFGILEGDAPGKSSQGWTKPKRIVVPAGLMPARIDEVKRGAPAAEFVPAKNAEAAATLAADADAVLGFASPEVLKAGTRLRWVQADDEAAPPVKAGVVVTDSRGAYGPPLADQAFSLLLALARKGRDG